MKEGGYMCRVRKFNTVLVILLIPSNIMTTRADAATLNKSSITLKVGDEYTLIVSGGKVEKWSSSKPGVASVENGKVTALNVGTTTITAKTSNSKITCKVTVQQTDNTKYRKNSYYANKKLKPGYYVLFNTNDSTKATFAIYKGKEVNVYNTIATDTFKYNAIVEVKKGQTLYMENCYAMEMSQAIVRTTGEGIFKVGTHIKAGKYKVKPIDGADISLYAISKKWNSEPIESMQLGLNAETEITVKNGQYLSLVGCKLNNKN